MLGLKSLFWLPAAAIAFWSESFPTFEVLGRQQFKKTRSLRAQNAMNFFVESEGIWRRKKKRGRIYQPYIFLKKTSDVWCFLQTQPFVLD